MSNRQPNIVYLHAHDAGRFVSPYGYGVETPNLMRFARSGIVFRQAYAAAPTCGPSRCALLTGCSPHSVGVYGLPGPQGWEVNDYGRHLARVLGAAGYTTALAGCMHECSTDRIDQLGYQHLLLGSADDTPGEFFEGTVDAAVRFLARDHADPFFLSVGIDEPHRNNMDGRRRLRIGSESDRFSKTRYYDPDLLDSRYSAVPPHLPDLPEVRRDFRSFAEGVRFMDEYMGRVLYALEHYGYRDNTVVVVTTDHGAEFPGGKKTLSDAGTGVMLMLRVPHGPAGVVLDDLVSQIDLYPTLLEMARVPVPDHVEGRSLCPRIDGIVDRHREEVFLEQTYHGDLEPHRAIRTPRHKLVLHHFPEGPSMRADGTVSRTVFGPMGWYDRHHGHEELFDLYLDPTEARNVVADEPYLDVAADLRRRLYEWMDRTSDPFPAGTFPDLPSETANR